jgi:hypothetical protein
MREQGPLGMTSTLGSLGIEEAQDSSKYLTRPLSSVASASRKLGHLVNQAMTFSRLIAKRRGAS